MKYYGNTNKKNLVVIDEVDWCDIKSEDNPIGFLNSANLYEKYVFKKRVSLGYDVKRQAFEEGCLWVDGVFGMKCVEHDGVTCYIGEIQDDSYKGKRTCERKYGIYAEMPRIYDQDGVFKWKENKKYETKECTIATNKFTFEVFVKLNGNAVIDAKYTACDNKHRNNVTVARIDVYNASNQDILNAIKAWKESMIKELAA